MILVSKKTTRPAGSDKDVPSRSHSLDAGAAWAYLALEASILGWPAHAMVGMDFDRARKDLNVPDDYHVEMAIALGKRGDKAALPEVFRRSNSRTRASRCPRSRSRAGFRRADAPARH